MPGPGIQGCWPWAVAGDIKLMSELWPQDRKRGQKTKHSYWRHSRLCKPKGNSRGASQGSMQTGLWLNRDRSGISSLEARSRHCSNNPLACPSSVAQQPKGTASGEEAKEMPLVERAKSM